MRALAFLAAAALAAFLAVAPAALAQGGHPAGDSTAAGTEYSQRIYERHRDDQIDRAARAGTERSREEDAIRHLNNQ